MSNLFNYLTTNPRAGSVSPVVDLFNTAFGDNFATPASFSNDNIRFNESEDGARIEIDLPGVKKENLKVTYSEESNNVYVEAKRTITTKTGSKEETYTTFSLLDPEFILRSPPILGATTLRHKYRSSTNMS